MEMLDCLPGDLVKAILCPFSQIEGYGIVSRVSDYFYEIDLTGDYGDVITIAVEKHGIMQRLRITYEGTS